MQPKYAVIYARYSSERQTEQSIEGQLTVCKKFAQDNGFVILTEYIDRATTGTNDNRPAFQAMLKDSAEHKWQYVLVYKGDRFSRNRIESALNKKTLKDNGVKLVSATENIPDTPEGIILESLLEGMAEYYSAELSQKIKRGIAESKKKKQFTGGHIIYGYDIVDKKPVVNHSEAAVIISIYQEYIEGKTAREIESELLAKGVRDKQGNPLELKKIYKILQQQKYAGTEIYPNIITQEMRACVDAITEKNKKAPARKTSISHYLLSGKLICGECGGMMTGESGTSKTGAVHYYYKCSEKKRHAKPCTFPAIKKDEIENKVFEVCCEVLNSGFIPRIVDMAYKIHQDEVAANITIINLQAILDEKEKAINNIMSAIEQGIFTTTTRDRLLELEKEADSIRYQLESEKITAGKTVTKDDYYAFLNKLMNNQTNNEFFKNDVIDMLVRQVIVFRDKIRITFNYSPDKNRGKSRDYKVDTNELAEAQAEHREGVKSSNLFLLAPPNKKYRFDTLY